jgi:predicted NBD/HSP70 family sugar kinase
MNKKHANRDWMKRVNRNVVLNLVKSAGPISRRDIARRSGLSPATITNLTAEFIAEGRIHEMGSGEAVRGRPPILLRLNTQAGYVVGVKVMRGSLAVVVTDLDAVVIHYQTEPLAASGDGSTMSSLEVLEAVAVMVETALTASGVDRSDVLGVGLGLAGWIDGRAGVCHYSPFFGWRDVDLVGPLHSALGFDVFVENDVNALTIAEQWFGHGHDRSHFAVVTIGFGIGLGLVLDGQFYRGSGGSAGELGHTTIVVDGPECTCGKRGCLEAVASDIAVIRQVNEAITAGQDTSLVSGPVTIDVIVAAADDGDFLAQNVLAQSGRWLGVGLANVANILGPELIIVGGEGVAAGHWRLDPMRSAFAEYAFDDVAERTEVIIELAGDETWARGAACVVLGEIYKSPLLDQAADPPERLAATVTTSDS